MDKETEIKAVEAWQTNDTIHPLTCGNDSNHKPLVARERDGKIILACLDCNYQQNWIPEIVIEAYQDGFHERRKEMLRKFMGL